MRNESLIAESDSLLQCCRRCAKSDMACRGVHCKGSKFSLSKHPTESSADRRNSSKLSHLTARRGHPRRWHFVLGGDKNHVCETMKFRTKAAWRRCSSNRALKFELGTSYVNQHPLERAFQQSADLLSFVGKLSLVLSFRGVSYAILHIYHCTPSTPLTWAWNIYIFMNVRYNRMTDLNRPRGKIFRVERWWDMCRWWGWDGRAGCRQSFQLRKSMTKVTEPSWWNVGDTVATTLCKLIESPSVYTPAAVHIEMNLLGSLAAVVPKGCVSIMNFRTLPGGKFITIW